MLNVTPEVFELISKKVETDFVFLQWMYGFRTVVFFFLALYILIMAMFHFFWSALKEIIYAYVGSF